MRKGFSFIKRWYKRFPPKVVISLFVGGVTLLPLQGVQVLAQPNENPTLLSQVNSNDTNGWNGAGWGMSKEQIQSLFPGAVSANPDRNGNTVLLLQNFDIANEVFKVTFTFSNDELIRVSLVLTKPYGVEGAAIIRNTFSSVNAQLIARYGNPHRVSDLGAASAFTWYLPSTQITIIPFLGYGSRIGTDESFNSLSILYNRRTGVVF